MKTKNFLIIILIIVLGIKYSNAQKDTLSMFLLAEGQFFQIPNGKHNYVLSPGNPAIIDSLEWSCLSVDPIVVSNDFYFTPEHPGRIACVCPAKDIQRWR